MKKDNNNKELTKKAELRSDDDKVCPFGLSICDGACSIVGNIIDNMAPFIILGKDATDEDKEEIRKANQYLCRWKCPGERCRYADQIIKGDNGNDQFVECNFGEPDAGAREDSALVGSPFFYKHLSGIGMDGLFSYPLGYYSDNSIDKSMYYGLYSTESTGAAEENIIEKTADEDTQTNKNI